MAKVDWITWKTEPSEIINPDNINNQITDLYQEYNNYVDSTICNELVHEMTNGGLDNDSLNIVGVSPAKEYSIKIMNSIDNIKSAMEELKLSVYNDSLEQRKIEKKQLIDAINKKIEEEKRILENTKILKEKVLKSNNFLNLIEIDNILDVTYEKIKRLETKLERAESL